MADVVWQPSEEVIYSTRMYQWMKRLGYEDYDTFLQASTTNIHWFWQEAERELGISWFKPYHEVLNVDRGIQWPKWFVGGKLNATFNAVEKWAETNGMEKALIWESEDGAVRQYTYHQLAELVGRAANGLKKEGVKKGDVVAIYMPMVPETVVAMLAISKIGAIQTPVFSGYGADAVATRLNASKAKMLITADGFLRRGKVVRMKEVADQAVTMSPSIKKVVVFKRLANEIPWTKNRDMNWDELIDGQPLKETEEMDSSDPLMIIYTSGTTGKPKGAVHTHSGMPVKAAFDAGLGMDLKKGDTLFWVTDMGWIMGPFLVYGGLTNGATILLYEGTPSFPLPDRIWQIVTKHKVTHLGISPTLVRTLMNEGDEWAEKHPMGSLRVIGSTGEPWNTEPWMWLYGKVGKGRTPIFNYSGGTEIGGGILGNVLIRPIGPITFNSPLPGMDADVFSEQGHSVTNEVGELVLKQPWVGMTNGFWQEDKRYEETYWSRWNNVWVHGDWIIKDNEQYWTITGRSDDIINVAGKRLGPTELESALVAHPLVAETAAIGVPDEIKGEAIVCFVVLQKGVTPTGTLQNELSELVGTKMGKALKPKEIHFICDLPKTKNAKVMRRAVKAAYLNKNAGDLSSLENPQVLEAIRNLQIKRERY